MKLRVLVTTRTPNEGEVSRILKLEKDYIIVGHMGTDVVIDDRRCSNRHLTLSERANGQLIFVDLQSRNRAWIGLK